MVASTNFNILTLAFFAFLDESSSTLKCKICADSESSIHIDFYDNRRISYDIPKPFCREHGEVTCSEDQDACITVVQPSRPDSYSYLITKGCSYKRKYPVLGCTRKKETVRGVQFINGGASRHERKVSTNELPQDTCVCDWAFCNGSTSNSFRYPMAVFLTIKLLQYILRENF